MKNLIDEFIRVHAYRQAEWMDDGILLISDLDGAPKLYHMKDGELKNLSPDLDRVLGYRKDLDNKIVFLVHDIGGNERWYITGLNLPKEEVIFRIGDSVSINIPGKPHPKKKILPYSTNRNDPRQFEIYIYNYGDGSEHKVYGPSENLNVGEVSPDGRKVVVIKNIMTWEQHVYFVDTENGEVIDSLEYPDTHLSNIHWIDNEKLYLITDYNADKRYIAEYTLNGSLEKIKEEPYEIELLEHKNGKLIYSMNVSGNSVLKIDDEEINKPLGVVAHIDVTKDYLFSIHTVRYGESIWRLEDGELKPVIYCKKLDKLSKYIIEPEVHKTRTTDGIEIESLVYRPEKPRGAVIYPHGGPESQSRPIYNPVIQILVNNGFTIVQPNYRGSTGYGKEFRHMDDKRKRERSLKDIVKIFENLRSKGVIDKNKVAVLGGSYGGFATLYLITHYPKLWKAAISVVGISNLETFLKNTGPWRRKIREKEYGSLDEDLDFLRKISPIYYIDRIEAPLLLIHGRNDPRVPVEESIQIHDELKKMGKEVGIHIFEDEGHGVAKLKNRIVYIDLIVKWLSKYIRDN